jgi:hypothetical protein
MKLQADPHLTTGCTALEIPLERSVMPPTAPTSSGYPAVWRDLGIERAEALQGRSSNNVVVLTI